MEAHYAFQRLVLSKNKMKKCVETPSRMLNFQYNVWGTCAEQFKMLNKMSHTKYGKGFCKGNQ